MKFFLHSLCKRRGKNRKKQTSNSATGFYTCLNGHILKGNQRGGVDIICRSRLLHMSVPASAQASLRWVGEESRWVQNITQLKKPQRLLPLLKLVGLVPRKPICWTLSSSPKLSDYGSPNSLPVTYFKHFGKRMMDHKVQLHPEPLSYSVASWYAHLCASTFRPLFHAKSAMISSWPLIVLSLE